MKKREGLRGGRLIDPANGIAALQDLYIAAGRVVGRGSAPAGFEADRSIDASGLAVLPGLVDLSARLREPGFEYRATLESEMNAAWLAASPAWSCRPIPTRY